MQLASLPLRAACLATVLVSACRATAQHEQLELDGAVLLGVRDQSGWENSSAPLLHLDGAARPLSWPVGVKLSMSLSGYFGDDTGEQTADFGLGLARSFELVPDRLSASLGAGRLFLSTDSGDLFANESDNWQANYVEAGLYLALDSTGEFTLGLEARYSKGDSPDLGGRQLDGDFLDLYLVFGMRPSSAPPAGATP